MARAANWRGGGIGRGATAGSQAAQQRPDELPRQGRTSVGGSRVGIAAGGPPPPPSSQELRG